MLASIPLAIRSVAFTFLRSLEYIPDAKTPFSIHKWCKRGNGGCGLFALQSPAQMEEVYGRAAAQTIIGNCGTRVIFSEHDPEVAAKISRSLGEAEIKEYQEGLSYGAHEVRDGVTLSLQSKKQPLISPTGIKTTIHRRYRGPLLSSKGAAQTKTHHALYLS